MSERCLHCYVQGRVQGVFFRASTQAEAERLSLRGFARNRPDGSVEVVACGPASAVDALRAWLGQGPEQARVDAVVDAGDTPGEVPAGFQVR